MRKINWFFLLVLLLVAVPSIVAQQCLSIVTDALEMTQNACTSTARNEVCYGYNSVVALPNVNPNAFKFEEQGDIVPLDDIAAMQLSPFDEDNEEWGIVVARLQAQLPDTLPGQNVTVVIFGEVNFQNQGVDTEGVQAFRFDSGIGGQRCLGLPPDGLIVETPENSSMITSSVNGVEISLASTAFLKATPAKDEGYTMLVGMLDGTGFISAEGETVRISAEEQTTIPLDDNLNPAGPPTPAEPFDTASLLAMYAFVQGLEFDDAPTGDEPPVATATAVSNEPCTISTDTAFSAGLRVGPGLNRTRRTWLEANKSVTVTGISDDGQWWQLDKFEAFPSGAYSVNELWVNVDEVTTSGNCSDISNAAAPPIVFPPPQGAPTAVTEEADSGDVAPDTGDTTQPIATQEVHQPVISYWADSTTLNSRIRCTNINWHIEYVNAVYLWASYLGQIGLSGITGSYRVCPSQTTTFYIQVVYPSGGYENFPITITVQ